MLMDADEGEAVIRVWGATSAVGVGVNGVNMMDIDCGDSAHDSDNVDSDNDNADTLHKESSENVSDSEPMFRRRRMS